MIGTCFGFSFSRTIGVVALLFSFLLTSCQRATPPASDSAVQASPSPATILPEPTRERAYDFTLTTLKGERVTLSEHEGDWVLVNFWATWCPPCVREMPYLQEIAETRDVHVLGINMGESEAQVRDFVDEHNVTFPILMGADRVLTIAYNARSLPQTYVITPDGSIALRIFGELQIKQFDRWLDEQGIEKR